MIDIGAGTMDILCYDTRSGEHFKAVAPSPVRHVADQIERTKGPLAVSGVEMGGGPVTEALRRRAETDRIRISISAAATLHHDMDRVRGWGLTIEDNRTIEKLSTDPHFTAIRLGDVQPGRIARLIAGLGLPMTFEAVALCAQDHGLAPPGMSHLDFRHNLFQTIIAERSTPFDLLYDRNEVPKDFNRLRSMAADAAMLDTRKVYVMDSGMAAMCGASRDIAALASPVIILDIATSHTVAAAMEGDRVAGFVEYHTRDITLERLESLLIELADGRIRHEQILAEGGHGAYLDHAVGFDNIKAIIATGPKRRLMAESKLPIVWGAPWGDNMMTGTVGLLEAVRRKKEMAPIQYL